MCVASYVLAQVEVCCSERSESAGGWMRPDIGGVRKVSRFGPNGVDVTPPEVDNRLVDGTRAGKRLSSVSPGGCWCCCSDGVFNLHKIKSFR